MTAPATAEQPLGAFMEDLAAARPSPSAGTVIAVTVAGAAGLTAMGARLSRDVDADGATAAAADACRDRALQLADEDADAYGEVLAVRRHADEPDAQQRVVATWTQATEVPLELAELAERVGGLAAKLLERANKSLSGEVATAVDLAAAAAGAAARLVRINVAEGGLEQPGRLGADLLARAARAETGATGHAGRHHAP